jgi:hypothetical protein
MVAFLLLFYLSDDDWCSINLTDDGGLSGNYGNNLTFEKTFHPDISGKIALPCRRNLEEDFDFKDK